MTIGYIAQEISPDHVSVDIIDQILSQLIENLLHPDKEIVLSAINALLNFIMYARKNMTVDKERDYILVSIFQACSHVDVEIRVFAMQCLVEISRIYYDYLQSHIDRFIQVTKKHVKYYNLDA
jgi:importin subunit beta-1